MSPYKIFVEKSNETVDIYPAFRLKSSREKNMIVIIIVMIMTNMTCNGKPNTRPYTF